MNKKLIINGACVFLSALIIFAGVMTLSFLLENEEKSVLEEKGTISPEYVVPLSFSENERDAFSYEDIFMRAFAMSSGAFTDAATPIEGELSMMDATVNAMMEYSILVGQGCVPEIDWSPFQVVASNYGVSEYYTGDDDTPEVFGMWTIEFQARGTGEYLMMRTDGRTGRICALYEGVSVDNGNIRSFNYNDNLAKNFALYFGMDESDIKDDSYDGGVNNMYEQTIMESLNGIYYTRPCICHIEDVMIEGSCDYSNNMLYISLFISTIY